MFTDLETGRFRFDERNGFVLHEDPNGYFVIEYTGPDGRIVRDFISPTERASVALLNQIKLRMIQDWRDASRP